MTNELPALKDLAAKATLEEIFDGVDAVLRNKPALARNVKLYLCQRFSGKKLKAIGTHFGIGESGVSQASRRMVEKLKQDKKLNKTMAKLKKQLNLSRMKT